MVLILTLFDFPVLTLFCFLPWQGAGEVVLLNLEDMVTLLLSCNIPGLKRAVVRNTINLAPGAAAPQAMANAMAKASGLISGKRAIAEGMNQPPAKRQNFGQTMGGTNQQPQISSTSGLIPPSTEGIKFYSRNDVLCGRGGGTNVHPGNRRFRDLINANRRAYLNARKNDKPAISRSIVRTVRELNGRFLKKDDKLGLWFEIGDDGAREKTSQALRQRAPEMRKILIEDEQRQVRFDIDSRACRSYLQ